MPNLIIILSFLTCSFVFSLEYFIVADLGSTAMFTSLQIQK